MRKRILATLIAAASLVVSATTASAASGYETADLVGQGLGGSVVAPGGAAILRTPTGVAASVTMSTPEPDSYTYPTSGAATDKAGHPEAFSLWVFVFFNPEECAGPVCAPGDLMNDPDVIAGAFNAGGHLEGGPNLNLQGFVNMNTSTFGGANVNGAIEGQPGPETLGYAMSLGYDLADADIHLAVAPHGALVPALLPASISTPAGTPDNWWIAIFPPVS